MYSAVLYTVVLVCGGGLYCITEIIYRKRTHYCMFFCAGYASTIMFGVYLSFGKGNPIIFALLGTVIITSLEFIFGVVFNIILKCNVWNYSKTPFNLYGQICLPFCGIWFIFSLVLYYIFKLIELFIFL